MSKDQTGYGERPEDHEHRMRLIMNCRQQVLDVIRMTQAENGVAVLVDLRDPVGAELARVTHPHEDVAATLAICKRTGLTPAVAFTGPPELAHGIMLALCPSALPYLDAKVQLGYMRCLVVAAGGIQVTEIRVTDLPPETLN